MSTNGVRVREVMTEHPVELPASASASDAAAAMRRLNVGAVLVMTDHQGLCGIVTDRDLVIRAMASGKDPKNVKLEDICSREVTSLGPDDSVEKAVKLMREKAVRRLPVLDESKPVGIVSLGDLALRLDRKSALGDISAAQPNL